ncbi:MAG: TrkA C-terminal domain-containing protein [Spirochaetales bacterium]|nr:TrkA C-terminal domain-containing protein [Spirochaetales bacterium]
MAALLSFFVILLISLTIVRIATVMLKMTGLSEDIARFQARSAFTGTGFTTRESESIIHHPVRRRIIQNLMLTGNIGIVSFISSLLLTFMTGRTENDLLLRFGILLGGALFIFLLSRTKPFNWVMSKVIESILRKRTHLYTKDYDSLLFLSGEYEIIKIKVNPGTWLSENTLSALKLSDEGVLVIGIRRMDGYFIGSPRGDTVIYGNDELILYGKEKILIDLGSRPAGEHGDKIHIENVRMVHESEGRLPPSVAARKNILKSIFKKKQT